MNRWNKVEGLVDQASIDIYQHVFTNFIAQNKSAFDILWELLNRIREIRNRPRAQESSAKLTYKIVVDHLIMERKFITSQEYNKLLDLLKEDQQGLIWRPHPDIFPMIRSLIQDPPMLVPVARPTRVQKLPFPAARPAQVQSLSFPPGPLQKTRVTLDTDVQLDANTWSLSSAGVFGVFVSGLVVGGIVGSMTGGCQSRRHRD